MLRLVQPDVIPNLEAIRDLRTEAEVIEAWYGPNAYSQYIRQHYRRPDPETAADIGRLLGTRVEASDGSMQPPHNAADRAFLKSNKKRRKAYAQRRERLMRLKMALAALTEPVDNFEELARDALADAPEMAASVDSAICYLKRFAECCGVQIKTETENAKVHRGSVEQAQRSDH